MSRSGEPNRRASGRGRLGCALLSSGGSHRRCAAGAPTASDAPAVGAGGARGWVAPRGSEECFFVPVPLGGRGGGGGERRAPPPLAALPTCGRSPWSPPLLSANRQGEPALGGCPSPGLSAGLA